MTLLRGASLDDDRLSIAGKQIEVLMDQAIDEMKSTGDLNVQGRLDSMYEQVERLIEQLAESPREGSSG